LEGLGEVSAWIEQYKKYWMDQFDSLDKYLTKIQSEKKTDK
jgi:hypothetical protein